MGVSDDLSDDAIMRSIRAMRAGNAIWKELLPILKRTERELIERLDEIGGTRSFQSARAEKMLREIRRIIDDGAQKFYARLEKNGIDLAGIEGSAAAASLTTHVPIAVNYVVPASQLLRAVAVELPFDGAILKDHLSKWSADTIFRMQGEIRTAIVQGETIEKMQRRLRGVADIRIDHARSIATTYTAHVTNAARAETYQANSDVIAGEMWTATLDDRTCLRCAPLDNKVFPLGKGPRPPLHMRCRCVRVPVIKGRDELIKAGLLKEGTRASIDGQVPASLKYEDWLRRQREGRQKEVLGAKRLEAWKKGAKLDKFVNDENEIIPLASLNLGNKAPASSAPPLARLNSDAKLGVIERGSESGTEHLVVIDEIGGKMIAQASGTKSFVGFSNELDALTKDPAQSLMMHHNHPNSASLSVQDVLIAMRPGVSGVWAHGHNGSSYFVAKAGKAIPDQKIKAFEKKVFNNLQQMVFDKKITAKSAGMVHNHFTWVAMNKKGLLKYEATLDGDRKTAFDDVFDILSDLLEKL